MGLDRVDRLLKCRRGGFVGQSIDVAHQKCSALHLRQCRHLGVDAFKQLMRHGFVLRARCSSEPVVVSSFKVHHAAQPRRVLFRARRTGLNAYSTFE
jgi:hypothetical protein